MRVPDDLTRSIGSWAGPAGAAWLAALPGLVAALAAEWGLAVGEPFQPSGYASLALRATRAGDPCVLKLRFPDEWSRYEGAALRHYGGGAAVALLAEDERRAALLLERCDPGSPLAREPDDVAARVVAGLARELWAPPPDGHPFRSVAGIAPVWAGEIRAGGAFDPRLAAEALETLDALVATAPAPVVLHGDLHAANVLRAARRPWLAIDPKPLAGDPAHDLAAVIRDRPAAGLVRRRFAIVCEVTGCDPGRVRGWALVQSVAGAAWSYAAGDGSSGAEFAAAAALVAPLPH
ncbi:MAG TPA: aminoglycoside phosphotransferase family protein [Frankiaceae bacterium]|nr:aminoglycoside phosphotransferase family protein [Frankiaceae bacterium]